MNMARNAYLEDDEEAEQPGEEDGDVRGDVAEVGDHPAAGALALRGVPVGPCSSAR